MTSSTLPDDVGNQGVAFIEGLNAKIQSLVAEFASGRINRTQFQQIYDRYQSRLIAVKQLMANQNFNALTEHFDHMSADEQTIAIRKRLIAKAIGMSIYQNSSGMPVETIGEFKIDTALIVPMLSTFRSAAVEMFSAPMRSTVLENGQWLHFVPGQFTTLIALFSLEPSEQQMEIVHHMHQDFEKANQKALSCEFIDAGALVYPFHSFIARHTGRE